VIIPAEQTSTATSREALDLLLALVGDYCEYGWQRDDGFSFVALAGDQVAAAAIGLPLAPGDRAHINRAIRNNHLDLRQPAALELAHTLREQQPTGELFALAVAPEFRGQGLAKALISARLTAFQDAGFQLAIAESWINPAGGQSAPLYRSLGFTEMVAAPGYWADERTESNHATKGCPSCGPLCKCAAILFGKDLTC